MVEGYTRFYRYLKLAGFLAVMLAINTVIINEFDFQLGYTSVFGPNFHTPANHLLLALVEYTSFIIAFFLCDFNGYNNG